MNDLSSLQVLIITGVMLIACITSLFALIGFIYTIFKETHRLDR